MSTQEENTSDDCLIVISALEIELDSSSCRNVTCALTHVFRSRQRPAAIVQALLSKITLNHVQQSYQTFLQEHYLVRKDDDDDDDSSLMLQVMKRVAATVWFLQLLLECPFVCDGLSEQRLHEMAITLLQHFIKTIQTLLQRQQQRPNVENEDEDECITESTPLNASTVASFAVGALVQGINPYVSTRPILLSPLWKGICSLVSLVGPSTMPSEVADGTLVALCTYLQEGTRQTMHALKEYIDSKRISPQFAFQLKIVTFLVAKCAVLLSSRRQQQERSGLKTTTAVKQAMFLLLQLRGLTVATRTSLWNMYSCVTPPDETFLSQLASLQLKVEQCLLLDSFDNLQLLLRLQPKSCKKKKELHSLASSSFYMGKALLWNRLLVNTVHEISSEESSPDPHTMQFLMKMIQELLFSTLPSCGSTATTTTTTTTSIMTCEQEDLKSSSLLAMVSATSVCYIKGPVEMRSQLNRLLAQWLAPPTVHDKQVHSLTREWVISLVHLHVLSVAQSGQEEDARSDSPTSVDIGDESDVVSSCIGSIKPLVSLLVKILVDSRTRTVHRRNVASVVIRLLHHTNDHCTANDSSVYKISLMVQQMVAMEVQHILKLNVKAQRRKRKGNKTSNDNDTTSRRRPTPPLGSFAAADDVVVLVQVLKHVSIYALPSLDGLLSGLVRDLAAGAVDGSSSFKNCNYTIGNYSRNAVSLLLALASGTMETNTPESFKSKTGVEVGDFVSFLITWLASQRGGSNHHQARPMGVRQSHAVAIVACLDVIRASFHHVAIKGNQLRAIVNVVKEYSRVSCQVLQLDSPPRSADEWQSAVSLLFAVTALLQGTARAIPATCPPDILNGIASTYKMLFETKAWPIVARTVTSLVQFASTIPSAHQGILPECIPTASQGLLQCRLQGLVYRDADSHKESESIAVNESCSKILKRLIPSLKSKESLFATTSHDCILEGSYILTMPTENGRTAKIIFAPGEESLSDIKYMLGKDDFDGVQVRQLAQVRLMGNGCRFQSKVLEL